MKSIHQKIHQIPKVELHSHLEGTIQPSLVKQIAKRNNIILRDGLFTPQGGFAWEDFVTFLQAYDEVSSCLQIAKTIETLPMITLNPVHLRERFMLKHLFLLITLLKWV